MASRSSNRKNSGRTRKHSAATPDNLSTKIRMAHGILTSDSPEQDVFVDAIKSGNGNVVGECIQENSPGILLAQAFCIPLNMDRDTRAKPHLSPVTAKYTVKKPKGSFTSFNSNDSKREQNDNEPRPHDGATMVVMPFHLAIIANQASIVKIILESIWNMPMRQKRVETLERVLTDEVAVEFTNVLAIYEKNDRSLDGMNCFHLSAKYCTPALNEIFKFLEEHHLMDHPDLMIALEGKDNHLHQTPLHVAAKNSTATAARYVKYDRLLML